MTNRPPPAPPPTPVPPIDGPPPESKPGRPGPVYDGAISAVLQAAPEALCAALGIPFRGRASLLPTRLNAWPMIADAVVRTGPGRIDQLEFTVTTPRGLVPRLLMYRGLLMRDHPHDHIAQHLIVMGRRGTLRGHDRPERHGFWLDVHVVHLRDLDPESFLGDVNLAPLACLTSGDEDRRAESSARAMRLIQDRGGERAGDLLAHTGTLAALALSPATMEKIVKEVGMTAESIAAKLYNTEWGHVLRGMGRVQGRAEGRAEKELQSLTEILQERFGQDPAVPGVAARLSTWPSGAVHAAMTAASLAELSTARPPTA